jgi:hypothetical protein
MLLRTTISGICSLEGKLGVLYSVLSDLLINTMDAFGADRPHNVAIA